MNPRNLNLIITAISLISSFGCTRPAVRPPEHIREYPECTVHAAALHSSKAMQIELKDIDRVAFLGIPKTDLSVIVTDTVPGVDFHTETARYEKIKIDFAVLFDGDTLPLEQRKTAYVPWADIITVAGSEIVFDSLDGRYDPVREIVTGCTVEGDSESVALDDIAYVRTMIKDYVVPLTTAGGLLVLLLIIAL